MNLRRHRRAIFGAATATLLVAGGVSVAVASADNSGEECAPVSHPATDEPGGDLADINVDGLNAAMADLPSEYATSAQVVIGGEQEWEGATGVADRESMEAAALDNRVRIGSVTKVFNSAIVLQLADEGTVDLDASVRDYLPDLIPEEYTGVTVGQLLNHTSGLPVPHIDGSDEFQWQYEHRFDHWDTREVLAEAFAGPLEFIPGAAQHYSNVNTMVSGLVIEAVTGHSWEHELDERIVEPLDLDDTYAPGDSVKIKGDHQNGYQKIADTGEASDYLDVSKWDQSITWASGDMISTPGDLQTFTAALFAGEVVPQSRLDNMFTVPQVPVFDGDDDECNDTAATKTMGLERLEMPDGTVVWGKSGARPGYANGIGGTRDGQRILTYSVTSTDAKGEAQTEHPVLGGIIAASFGL